MAYLLSHKGPGGLEEYLINSELITGIKVDYSCGAKGFRFFRIKILLTEKGLEKHEDIIKTVFEILRHLKGKKILERIWNELRDIYAIRYHFKAKQNPLELVEKLSTSLQVKGDLFFMF